MSTAPARRFDPAALAGLDEPVRRYLMHALRPDALVGAGVRLQMNGRIKVGVWLPFAAVWEGDARSFVWRAAVGPRPLRVLRVVDRFAGGGASMDVRLFGRIPLLHAEDEDTQRSGAGRAAVEATWTPGSLLPERGVSWRAESDDVIVGSWDVPPERPDVRLRIDAAGAVRSSSVMRWDSGQHGRHGYIPCGGIVHAERSFGEITIPSRLTAGWWFDTPRWDPFFEAEVVAAEQLVGGEAEVDKPGVSGAREQRRLEAVPSLWAPGSPRPERNRSFPRRGS